MSPEFAKACHSSIATTYRTIYAVNLLLPPTWTSTYAQLLLLAGRSAVVSAVVVRHQGHDEVRTVLPRREDLSGDRGVLIVSYASHKKKAYSFFLLQVIADICLNSLVLSQCIE